MDEDRHALAGEVPCAPGVVEMDVREEQRREVAGREPEVRQLADEPLEGHGAAALHQHRALRLRIGGHPGATARPAKLGHVAGLVSELKAAAVHGDYTQACIEGLGLGRG